MSTTVFSFDKFYQTQPPIHVSDSKVASILEYLAFSGSPIYLEIALGKNQNIKPVDAALVLDVTEDHLLIQTKNITHSIEVPTKIHVSFGYKRKRAEFESQLISWDGSTAKISIPTKISLTNLRRNPRLKVSAEILKLNPKYRLTATTSVGAVEISNVQINEISQLGMSIYVDRKQGLILQGDKINEFEIELDGSQVFRVQGIVSRVDMKRKSDLVPNSYEVIVLFQRASKMQFGPIERASKRVPILEAKPCFFSAEHPFFPGRKIEGQLIEISSSGFTCILEKTNFPVVPGMRFKKCNLQLPHRPSRQLTFDVVHIEFKSDGESNQFKVGGEFISAPVELHKDISAYTQEVAGGLIQDVTEEDFDLLWEFLFETNFVYQNKRRQIQQNSKEILETYHRLLSTDNPIVKKVVFKEEGEIKGHLSALRFYDHTWIFQHLNALKSSKQSAAQAVLSAMVNFFYDAKANARNDTFYIMTFFRPDNLYPSILFGESCRRMNDPINASLIDFSFGTYESSEGFEGKAEILEDHSQAFIDLADLLIQRNLVSFMRAIGLGQVDSNKLSISESYENIGLKRERHLLSASSNDAKAFALVEISSPGLNLSELTNSIFIFSEGADSEISSGLAAQLVAKAAKTYFDPRGIDPVVLQPAGENRPQNVKWSKIYTCWANSAAGFPAFEKCSRSVLNEFPKLVEALRQAQAGEGLESKRA